MKISRLRVYLNILIDLLTIFLKALLPIIFAS
jgi:hypothetical protein